MSNHHLCRPFFFFFELLGFFLGRLLRLEPSDTEKLPSSKSLSTSGSSSSLYQRWRHIKKTVQTVEIEKQKGNLTEERFLLLLRPPNLILSGATFLGLDFGGGLGAGFDFLRAFGPENTEESMVKQENTIKYLK